MGVAHGDPQETEAMQLDLGAELGRAHVDSGGAITEQYHLLHTGSCLHRQGVAPRRVPGPARSGRGSGCRCRTSQMANRRSSGRPSSGRRSRRKQGSVSRPPRRRSAGRTLCGRGHGDRGPLTSSASRIMKSLPTPCILVNRIPRLGPSLPPRSAPGRRLGTGAKASVHALAAFGSAGAAPSR